MTVPAEASEQTKAVADVKQQDRPDRAERNSMAQHKLRFPLLGKDVNYAASTRPDLTSSDMNNVRPFDVLEERARGITRKS